MTRWSGLRKNLRADASEGERQDRDGDDRQSDEATEQHRD